jgi:TRAP-type C4-dicarboxylate transport system substrate-binding protein
MFTVAALAMAGGAGARTDLRTDTINWTFMSIVPPVAKGSSVGNFHQSFAREVEQRTQGQLKITVKTPGELPYAPAQTLANVGANRIQIGDGAAFVSGESKAVALTMMPFLISKQKQFVSAVKLIRPTLTADFARFGVESLYTYMWPLQVVWGKGSPPASLKDFKGMKIRTSTAEQAYLFSQLGASPVTLPTPEVAPSLQRGVVTGVTTAAYNALPSGWGQLLDWAYLQPINITPGFVVVNKDALAGLPQNLRTILRQVAAKWQTKMQTQIPRAEERYREAISKLGVRLIQPKPADQKLGVGMMRPYWTKWAQDNNLSPQLSAIRKLLGR